MSDALTTQWLTFRLRRTYLKYYILKAMYIFLCFLYFYPLENFNSLSLLPCTTYIPVYTTIDRKIRGMEQVPWKFSTLFFFPPNNLYTNVYRNYYEAYLTTYIKNTRNNNGKMEGVTGPEEGREWGPLGVMC